MPTTKTIDVKIAFDSGPVLLSGYAGIASNFNIGKTTGFVRVASEVEGGDAFVVRSNAAGRVQGIGDYVAVAANAYNDFDLYFDPDSVTSGYLGSIRFESTLAGKTTLYEYKITVVPKAGTSGNDNIYGGTGNDSLSGLGGRDGLWGRGGADSFSGGTGDDYLVGGAGADVLDGGANFDTAGYDDATAGVLVDLSDLSLNTGDAAGDTFFNIERINGSLYGDTLRGNGSANDLQGADGNDVLSGRGGNDSLGGGSAADTICGDAGNDSLSGDAGNDWLVGGSGADRMNGGAGNDTVAYDGATSRVVVDLLLGLNDGDAKGDSFVGVERIVGTTGYGDILSGNGSANAFDGRGGNDTLVGFSGDDTLLGGDGGDELFGGAGKDSMDGGGGNDTISYELGGAVRLDLATPRNNKGDAAGDIISDVETVFGSLLNDTIAGDASDNKFFGRIGSDSLVGRNGADTLFGEYGSDTLLGDDGDDRLFGDDGADKLTGGTGDDHLDGGSGNDTFIFSGNWGTDTIADFDDGKDRISISGQKFKALTITQIDADGDGARDDVHIALLASAGQPGIDLIGVKLAAISSADFMF